LQKLIFSTWAKTPQEKLDAKSSEITF